MKYIQTKLIDFYLLKEDFNILEDNLSKLNLNDEIKTLINKVKDDIHDLESGEILVKTKKIKNKFKVKITYISDNNTEIKEPLKFDMDVNNPIIDVNYNKILNKIEFFVTTKNDGKKKVTKQVEHRVLDVIDIEWIGRNIQKKLV